MSTLKKILLTTLFILSIQSLADSEKITVKIRKYTGEILAVKLPDPQECKFKDFIDVLNQHVDTHGHSLLFNVNGEKIVNLFNKKDFEATQEAGDLIIDEEEDVLCHVSNS